MVQGQYEELRKKLVDTTLRNQMLSFRASRTHGAEVAGEDSSQVYKHLVEEGRKMSFVGKPDPPSFRKLTAVEVDDFSDPETLARLQKDAEDELAAYLINPVNGTDQTDNKLDTDYTVSNLSTRLLKSYRESQAIHEETGLNVLFLALGALYWKETETSSEERIAPLVFVPVILERLQNGQFKLAHNGDDVGDNLSLAVKLKADFGIDLPRLEDRTDLGAYFQELKGTFRHLKHWHVEEDWIALSFFQFSKLVMYLDLDETKWPEGRKPTEDPDLVALFGDGYEAVDDGLSENEFIDPLRPVGQCNEVFDCDSSQALAIIRAQTGRSMVIEGPPGTGKSQTIANLIAEFAGNGKTVLFVSEKMAALDVVVRRLESVGLGDLCLELHSRASRRKEFYDELKRVMALRGNVVKAEAEVNRLSSIRQRLNDYSQAVNEVVEPWGLTPHEAIGEACTLPDETVDDCQHRIPFASLRGLTWQDVKERLPIVEAFQQRLRQSGVPAEHPFYGSDLRVITPGLQLDVQESLRLASEALKDARGHASTLAAKLRLSEPNRPSDVTVMAACTERAVHAPPHDGVAVRLDTWEDSKAQVEECIESLKTLQSFRAKHGSKLSDAGWQYNLIESRAVYEQWAPRWWRFFSGDFRRSSRGLKAVFTSTAPTEPAEVLDLIRELQAAQVCRITVSEISSLMQQLFGVQWQGEDSNCDQLARLLEWCLELRGAVRDGRVPGGLLEFFEASRTSMDLAAIASEAGHKMHLALQALSDAYRLLQYDDSSLVEDDLSRLAERVDRCIASMARLPEIAQLNVAVANLRDAGLECVVEVSDRWPQAPSRLRDSLLRSFTEGILIEAMNARPALQGFDREDHEENVRQFRKLDDVVMHLNRARVRAAHLKGLPDWRVPAGNLHLVRMQTELQRRHKPIRWALDTAGKAVQQMKPIFLMSPLSVSQFLPRGDFRFDIVIFDEASQVKPEDALAAMVRADQTIVVGDSKQMPPTSFFDRMAGEADEDLEDVVQIVGQLESVLNLMAARVRGTSRWADLRWHYRSLHPSLIRPSNVEFYDSRLVIFPSPDHGSDGANGLRFHYDRSHVYDCGTGKSRKNVGQALAVAQAVVKHVQSCPEQTLGIAAFSKQQQEAIEDALELTRAQHQGLLESFDARHPFERLFVKNLETIQGDERDVVFISVGYGPGDHGQVSMTFGPINAEGGERRLNVLMSRARRRCEVFSSLTASDIRTHDAPGRGVQVFKKFLLFAETGELDDPKPSDREAGSPFEQQVASALREHGYSVDLQVGSIGYFIDLAVRNPSKPGQYALGIECDGASYHSARSARDRDKLRQAALEDRGWKLHRIWSTDWWQSREKEVERCLEAIARSLVDAEDEEGTESDEAPDFFVEYEAGSTGSRHAGAPYEAWRRSFNLNGIAFQDLSPEPLAKCVHTIVAFEGPIHIDLLTLRMRSSAGIGRAGSQVQAAVDRGLRTAVGSGWVVQEGDFLFAPGHERTSIRNWSALPTAEKKSEWVSHWEIGQAVMAVVRSAFGVTPEEAVTLGWKQLGFVACRAKMLAFGQTRVQSLAETGELVLREGKLYVPD